MPPDAPAAGETIGERLKRLRLDRGLSQRELAAPGVSYAYISRIEAGTRQPSVKALRRLAAKLGVSADYLETGSDLDAAGTRELRLADLELAVRLGGTEGADEALRALAEEALAAGDRPAAKRARVALAALAYDAGSFGEAVTLLEAALEGQPFDPVESRDVYSLLARSYAHSGRMPAAVELFERCLADERVSANAALEARYATLLSYALSDMGEIDRAEDVVRRALERSQDTRDPYTRVRLYWSLARLAHSEQRASVALANVRKAIALLEATEDTVHLGRAHVLAAAIMLGRDDPDAAEAHLDVAEQLLGAAATNVDLVEIRIRRSRVATLRAEPERAIALAREALELVGTADPVDRGLATVALAEGLVLAGDTDAADAAFGEAVELLESHDRLRDAASACRTWAQMLRERGREAKALDVLDRAAELGVRSSPERARSTR